MSSRNENITFYLRVHGLDLIDVQIRSTTHHNLALCDIQQALQKQKSMHIFLVGGVGLFVFVNVIGHKYII